MKIAVIGAGIAGNIAAWSLNQAHEVVLYEKRMRAGGHSATVDVDYDGVRIPVDTGFIVFNERNYPNFSALVDHLGVETGHTDMSFAVSRDDGAFEWSGHGLRTLFAQKRNLLRPGFHFMLLEILRFNRHARADLESGALRGLTLGAYLERRKFQKSFQDGYLVPMGAAIWSTPHVGILDFPAQGFIRFLRNHHLLQIRPPAWRTISGGSREYVQRLLWPLASTPGAMRLATPVARIRRHADLVEVIDINGEVDRFDQIVMAAHSDQTLDILGDDASADERRLLGSIRYRDNEVYLHRDHTLMPKRQAVWAAWNHMGSSRAMSETEGVGMSYWMNALQNIDNRYPLFVSLNPGHEPAPDRTFARFSYAHPQFDQAAFEAQEQLPTIQGVNRTWFCGAWCGYGFHEDGARAGLEVAGALGGVIPWRIDAAQAPMLPLREAAE